ncbi:hypothetical protein BU24DRAFT_424895 [Aaosphaeria arxii CBS 175.79]|uniref:Cwf18 pre-mRNA splicing factor n=1 Tax=Aaosphaeria arxii CBS 175.79 TaxID=1450172 RepID=A0A6A5XLN4_9PLEO|nr:uncharacterized protein BU24DRAFT_424895 [Aaosphaeria arxii CBS 175.79]KAF2013863.1 hypothetical protein BU24DRAFT_424895 [Aaosphaeria arxii CBS 175.79]
MPSHEALAAASNDRKARLAQLKSLKRKQAPTEDDSHNDSPDPSTALVRTEAEEEPSERPVTEVFLSGRNFDPTTRNVRLAFESGPIGDPTQTLEYKAAQIALSSKEAQAKEAKEDQPLDLFKLQPKRPNWDLKRDLEKKLESVDVWTENAIAKLVRERVEGQKKARSGQRVDGDDERQEVGMEGSELVEAMHLKEQEEEAERKRGDEDDGS